MNLDADKTVREFATGISNATRIFEQLKEFEADLHKHVHLENNVLFPRAIALESQA